MIFINTTPKFTFNLDEDLSSVSLTKIYYEKPDGTKGEWVPDVVGNSLVRQCVAGDIDQPGEWKFQPYIETNSGDQKYFSQIVKEIIYNPIN